MFRPLLIALQFLTILPIPLTVTPTPQETGRSLLYYPLVGLLIGLLLVTVAWILRTAPTMVVAALLLSLWVATSGALHLDGLADTADAWIGSHGDRDRMLTIMKDPRSGPIGVVTLVLVLLIKFTALLQLLTIGTPELIALAPILGRTTLIPLFLTTPYVRPQGLGSPLADHLPRRAATLTLTVTLVALFARYGTSLVIPLAIVTLTFLTLRQRLLRQLGGTTGDTAGAVTEIIETLTLLTMVLIF